ncbi:hypothetical protein BsWGS_18605 [Bradybaena similaris]
MQPFFEPTKCNNGLFGCESYHQGINLDNKLHSLSNSLDTIQGMPVIKDSNLFLSAFAAPVVNKMSNSTQRLLDNTAASQPVNCSVSENNYNQASATINNTSSSNCAVFKETMQDNDTCNANCSVLKETAQDINTETPVASLSIEKSSVTCSSNIAVESTQSTAMSSYSECLPDLSSDKCHLLETNCSSSNTQNCKKVMDSKLTGDDNKSQSALKPILNLTSVLSAPRKTIRKGRPSSKKQKKRQREKQKLSNQTLQTKEILESTHTGCVTEQKLHSQNKELMCAESKKSDISQTPSCNAQFEAAQDSVVNQTCPLRHLFVSLMSNSEDENSVEDDDDDQHDRNDYSVNKHNEIPVTPIKGLGFRCALDLDAIFKKSIPKSFFTTEKKADYAHKNDNGSQKNLYQSSSQHNSYDKRKPTSALPVSKNGDSCFFTPALSLDILFCKKPTPSTQAVVDLKETTFDLLDDVPSDDNPDHPTSSSEPDSETLEKVNASWNENYPTAGFRSCASASTDEIKHPTIKVHFAADPHFLTVHSVGTEERNGNWHHVIREREQFEKRILELEHILSPFLESSHRTKLLAQRSCQEQQ